MHETTRKNWYIYPINYLSWYFPCVRRTEVNCPPIIVIPKSIYSNSMSIESLRSHPNNDNMIIIINNNTSFSRCQPRVNCSKTEQNVERRKSNRRNTHLETSHRKYPLRMGRWRRIIGALGFGGRCSKTAQLSGSLEFSCWCFYMVHGWATILLHRKGRWALSGVCWCPHRTKRCWCWLCTWRPHTRHACPRHNTQHTHTKHCELWICDVRSEPNVVVALAKRKRKSARNGWTYFYVYSTFDANVHTQ